MGHVMRWIVAVAAFLCAAATPLPAVAAPNAPVVTPVTAADLGATWRTECPVGPADLRRVELTYAGFDGQQHRGALVVNRTVVDDVIAIFDQLQRLHYPIQRMQTVDHYPGAEDELSMQDNNTSAFNCRPLPGSKPGSKAWSQHAYGRAIDINPLINPYLDAGGDLQPKTAARYLDRSRDDPGILRADSPAVAAFTDHGWRWGGAWRNPVDYQHFEIG
ncbi:MAG TPA: M15 family metallopeptidase [Mycobacterium sp.]|nr:M15 family metallopeptidase [Mycobacterium sp.]